jgi:hypothetical protein
MKNNFTIVMVVTVTMMFVMMLMLTYRVVDQTCCVQITVFARFA